ncbi:MAG: hypothetical protein V4450_10940 [Bacteroidota bacterium]
MKKITAICSLSLMVLFANAQSTDNLKMVDSTNTFKLLTQPIERGTLIKTSNFHYYEINDKVIQKAGYPAQPEIIVYQDGKKYKMKIQGMDKLLLVNKVQEVIETKFEGDFKGWDGTSSFKMANGQTWKQDSPTSSIFSNLFRPAVMIYLTSEGYKMKIEGLNEDPIIVKRTN